MRDLAFSFHRDRIGMVELRRTVEVLFEFTDLALVDMSPGDIWNA